MVWAWAGSLLQTVARMTVAAQHMMSRKDVTESRSPTDVQLRNSFSKQHEPGVQGRLRVFSGIRWMLSGRTILRVTRTLLRTN